MKWIETTDKNNPLSCNGEYCSDIPWLQHSTNSGMAYYSVRKNISGLWESMFWHGNRDHSVGKPSKTEIEAKAKCFEHLKKMYVGFSVQIDKNFTGGLYTMNEYKKDKILRAQRDYDLLSNAGSFLVEYANTDFSGMRDPERNALNSILKMHIKYIMEVAVNNL